MKLHLIDSLHLPHNTPADQPPKEDHSNAYYCMEMVVVGTIAVFGSMYIVNTLFDWLSTLVH